MENRHYIVMCSDSSVFIFQGMVKWTVGVPQVIVYEHSGCIPGSFLKLYPSVDAYM